MSYTVFCMGNPLLDLQVTGGEKLLEEYELKANDAILADEKHAGMFVRCTIDRISWWPDLTIAMTKSCGTTRLPMSLEELRKMLLAVLPCVSTIETDPTHVLIAGPIQYVLPPKSVVYTGCVGDDELAEQLKAANAREGLDDVYYVKKGEKTGACAVVITGHHRYVITTLIVLARTALSKL